MIRAFLCFAALLLTACQAAPGIGSTSAKTEQLPEAINEKLYTPCAVIQDFLTEKQRVKRSPSSDTPSDQSDKLYYLKPQAMWVMSRLNRGEKVSTPQSSRTHMRYYAEILQSRSDVKIAEETFEAYYIAQDSSQSFTDCVLPKRFYRGADADTLITAMAKHNAIVRYGPEDVPDEQRRKWLANGGKYDEKKMDEYLDRFGDEKQPFVSYQFSRVGINPAGNQATFYYQYYCGQLCAEGVYVVMELKGHNWVVSHKAMVWIS